MRLPGKDASGNLDFVRPAEFGEECNGDLILTGVCAKRGHKVTRLVETSEHDNSGN